MDLVYFFIFRYNIYNIKHSNVIRVAVNVAVK